MGYTSNSKGSKKSSWSKPSSKGEQAWKGSWADDHQSWGKGSWSDWGTGSAPPSQKGGQTWDADGETARKGRLQVQYQFAKSALRGYADANGSAFYAPDDLAFVQLPHLARAHLTADNSNLLRHPATGISCAAGSIRAAAEVLSQLDADLTRSGIPALAELFKSAGGADFLEALQILNHDTGKRLQDAELTKSLQTVLAFVEKEGAGLAEGLGRLAIASSRLYLGAMLGLELAAMIQHSNDWVEKIPPTETDDPSLAAWKNRPTDAKKRLAALKTLFKEKEKRHMQFAGKGNRAADVFGTPWASATDDKDEGNQDSDSSSSDESDKKKKKKTNKNTKAKKGKKADVKKKDKKTKKSKKVASSSCSSSHSTTTEEEEEKKVKQHKRRVEQKEDGEQEKKKRAKGYGKGEATAAEDVIAANKEVQETAAEDVIAANKEVEETEQKKKKRAKTDKKEKSTGAEASKAGSDEIEEKDDKTGAEDGHAGTVDGDEKEEEEEQEKKKDGEGDDEGTETDGEKNQ